MAILASVAVHKMFNSLGIAPEDPHEWLENVGSESSLSFARERNAHAVQIIGEPTKSPIHDRILKILDSKDKIPYVHKIGDYYYNLWQDEQNRRGLWRRTTLEKYKLADPEWETVLDIDALNQAEGENWTWKGSTPLDMGPSERTDIALLKLSRGGADATVVREFNLDTKEFVKENAFFLPEAKSRVSYKSRDVVLVGTDTGDGSLTDSGYPRVVREWKRGTPLSASKVVFEGEKPDVAVSGYAYYDRGFMYDMVQRAMTFYTSQKFIRRGDELIKIDVPDDTEVSTFAAHLIIQLKKPWTINGQEYPTGSLLSTPIDDFLKGDTSKMVALFTPGARTSLEGHCGTKNYLVLSILDNVKTQLRYWKYDYDTHSWHQQEERKFQFPNMARLAVQALDPDYSDDLWLIRTGFTSPTTLFLGTAADDKHEKIKQLPSQYNSDGLIVTQSEATSKDGEKIPYFIVRREDMKHDGNNPTLLYGYGGFEISLLPYYMATAGCAWLEKGGVFVMANIRGGGEFGPKWHQAALKEKRHKAYEDFIAIGEHLISQKITKRERLAIQGGSNGGLLVGNMLVMRPDLWGAVVCQVPLLDMKRFNKLLAGASWMGEYGNPDIPEEWAFLKAYSPYHNVRKDVKYPPTIFTTSTRDDRVHPGHARKMVARMLEYKNPDVLYYENIEGGHGGAADNKQRAFMTTLVYEFLWKTIGSGKSSL